MASVHAMGTNSNNAAIALGQARQLRSMQCDVSQCYLVGKPLPTNEMTRFLTSYIPNQVPLDNEAFSTLLLWRERYPIFMATSGDEAQSLLALHHVGMPCPISGCPA